MTVKVRFAPSPTGTLHIGGARTALFNWLFARHNQGEFLLRVEDTDRERSTKEFEHSILAGMKWLGLDWDQAPIYQSERIELHKKQVQRLLDEGKAYYCTCSKETLDAKRQAAMKAGKKPVYDGTCRERTAKPSEPAAVRFKGPKKGTTTYKDLCRGPISFENKELDDLIIARSDGTPTYNFVVVVDDAEMKITHVIRGDDHINNTPRQVLLYQALGFDVPEFAHLPMIHGADKKKLSKRHGATSVIEYEEMGYLPTGMMNYLARLGWSHGDQEIFTNKELIEHFNLEAVGQSPAIFDTEKLGWVNSQHLANYTDDELLELARPHLARIGIVEFDNNYAAKALASERERGRTLKELAKISAFYFQDQVTYDEQAFSKWLAPHDGKKVLQDIYALLKNQDDYQQEKIANIFKAYLKEHKLKMPKVAQPCRVALVGTTVSPGVYEVIAILGKDKTLARIERALALL